jgi:hypothetical protein
MANINDIASYIYGRAPNFNVDPNLALGVARFEGLNPKTVGSPTFGNKDARGYSFGPFQLFSGSPDPSRIAPGGMAYEFQQKFGSAPSRENWQQQVDFALERMGKTGTGPWYAVRNRGGVGPVTQGGREYAETLGLLGDMNNYPEASSQIPRSAMPYNVPSDAEKMDRSYITPAAAPVYANDFATMARRAGNFLAPSLVDAPVALTPEQIAAQQAATTANAETSRQYNTAAAGLLNLARISAQPGQAPMMQMLQNEPVRGQYRPIPKTRGLL